MSIINKRQTKNQNVARSAAGDVRERTEQARRAAADQAAALQAYASDLKKGAAALSAAAVPTAVKTAEQAKGWAAPRLEGARENSREGLGRAYERSMKVAAPKVDNAATALVPRVDAIRTQIVDDVLPRLVDAVNAAASAAADKAGTATEQAAGRSSAALSGVSKSVSKHVPKKKRRSRLGQVLVVLGVTTAAGAAGWAVWKRQQPATDPWVPATATRTTAGGSRLSAVGEGENLGSGTAASQTTDVETPAPDGVTATPDDSGSSAPATSPATADPESSVTPGGADPAGRSSSTTGTPPAGTASTEPPGGSTRPRGNRKPGPTSGS